MRTATLLLFAAGLLICIAGGFSILYALVFGYLLFFLYGIRTGHTPRTLLLLSARSVRAVKNILLVLVFIGLLTAVWRACGTIPMILFASSRLISPEAFLLLTFLLNCLLSLLTGTSFGTAATMGVICMGIGAVMGLPPALLGGAVLSGAFFGDRGSPLSTSALLVAEVTKTDLFDNLKGMVPAAAAPFTLTCVLYLLLGRHSTGGTDSLALLRLFPLAFHLHWLTLLPAVLVILLSLGRRPVKVTLLLSILVGCVLCLTLQGASAGQLTRWLVLGYQTTDPRLAGMLNGGGLLSMGKPALIVGISCSYSGLFDGTGLLTGLQDRIHALSRRTTPYTGLLLTSVVAGIVSCNQTLTILLSHQLCLDCFSRRQDLALALEDTAVVLSPLVPWSIAGAVPLAALSAPTASLCFAFYLYLLPLMGLFFHRNAQARPLKP